MLISRHLKTWPKQPGFLSREMADQHDVADLVSAFATELATQVHQVLIAPLAQHGIFVEPTNVAASPTFRTEHFPLI